MKRNREIGQLLETQRRAFAEAVVVRQYELQPELRERYGTSGQDKCIHDTEYHLSYLATAITFSSPILFTEYIAWAKAVLFAYDVGLDDVQRNLICLRDVLTERLPDDMREVASSYMEAALRTLPVATTALPSFLAGDDPLAELASRYLQALLRAERYEATRLIHDAVRAGTTVQDIYLHVFQRSQWEIGRLWQLRQITVAQEHYATAATQLAMSQLYVHFSAQPRTGRRMLAASVSRELHEVGLRIVTDLFEAEGWDTVYLGASVPSESIVNAVSQHRPDLVAISATMAFHLSAVERLIALVRSTEAGRRVKILVGGYPFNIDLELWRRVGADGCAVGAAEALIEAERLLSLHEELQAETAAEEPGQSDAGAVGVQSQGEMAVYEELSRLNNELLTAQRELARKNAQLERLNERLIDADRRKDDFLATLAHELRNPLVPIRNGLELMRLAGDDREPFDDVREIMEEQAQHLVRLIDDLLDVARIRSGKVSLQKQRLELASVVQSAIEATRSAVESAGHELIIALPAQPIALEADATRLTQVFSNLLANAARCTEQGGRIWVTAEQQVSDVVVTVEDTGIGIPREMLGRIFEMYTQADRPAERSRGGLGIGLMLVKRLVEMHGGSVEVRSEGPGQGSEFTVRLPTLKEPHDEPQEIDNDGMAAFGRPRILVVDDNQAAAKMLSRMLETLGSEVRTAHDGLNAIAMASEFRPALVLMDLRMGSLNGYDTARRMREQEWGRNMVLAALTGWSQEEDRQRTKEAGFDHHLVKPVELSALQELLAQLPR